MACVCIEFNGHIKQREEDLFPDGRIRVITERERAHGLSQALLKKARQQRTEVYNTQGIRGCPQATPTVRQTWSTRRSSMGVVSQQPKVEEEPTFSPEQQAWLNKLYNSG